MLFILGLIVGFSIGLIIAVKMERDTSNYWWEFMQRMQAPRNTELEAWLNTYDEVEK